MDFTLGSPGLPPFFSKTPYEHLLGKALEITGFDLRKLFQSILERRGPDISVFDMMKEVEEPLQVFMDLYADEYPYQNEEQLKVQALFLSNWLWFAYQHFTGGEKVFRIHENLGKALNATDLKVPSAYLNLPYEGMSLIYEGNVAEILYGDAKGDLESIYITSREALPDAPERRPNSRIMSGFPRRPVGQGAPFIQAPSFIAYVPTLRQGRELVDEDYVRGILAEGKVDREKQNIPITLLVLKTIAYINSAGIDALELPAPDEAVEAILRDPALAPPREERRKIEKKLERSSHQPFIYIGSRLPTPREEPVAIVESGVRQMTHRFSVRGHFHNFWKLEKNLRDDEKSWIQEHDGEWVLVMKWVHPYEKGPTEAEKLHRRYFVEGSR